MQISFRRDMELGCVFPSRRINCYCCCCCLLMIYLISYLEQISYCFRCNQIDRKTCLRFLTFPVRDVFIIRRTSAEGSRISAADSRYTSSVIKMR